MSLEFRKVPHSTRHGCSLFLIAFIGGPATSSEGFLAAAGAERGGILSFVVTITISDIVRMDVSVLKT